MKCVPTLIPPRPTLPSRAKNSPGDLKPLGRLRGLGKGLGLCSGHRTCTPCTQGSGPPELGCRATPATHSSGLLVALGHTSGLGVPPATACHQKLGGGDIHQMACGWQLAQRWQPGVFWGGLCQAASGKTVGLGAPHRSGLIGCWILAINSLLVGTSSPEQPSEAAPSPPTPHPPYGEEILFLNSMPTVSQAACPSCLPPLQLQPVLAPPPST